MITSYSGLVEIGVRSRVEYCDNVIEQSTTGELDLLRFPVYIITPSDGTNASSIQFKFINKLKEVVNERTNRATEEKATRNIQRNYG